MPEIPAHLVQVGGSFAQTYQPVLDFHGWKVAMLRCFDVVDPRTFHRVERHANTNEVFILTAGQADLIVCDGDVVPGLPYVFSMQLNVAYNIGQGIWHHVVMSPDAHIVLIERSEVALEYAEIPTATLAEIKAQFSLNKEEIV